MPLLIPQAGLAAWRSSANGTRLQVRGWRPGGLVREGRDLRVGGEPRAMHLADISRLDGVVGEFCCDRIGAHGDEIG